MDVHVYSLYLSLVLDGLRQHVHVPLYILWHDSSEPRVLHLQSLKQPSETAALDGLIDITHSLVDWQGEREQGKRRESIPNVCSIS